MARVVEIWTDGACSGNPGPGGWAAILKSGEHYREISGGLDHTTNNVMELQACVEALKVLKGSYQVVLHTDAAYIVNCYRDGWALKWVKNDWRNSKDNLVANQELWQALFELAGYPELVKGRHAVRFAKVAGHAGVELNERCDELAREQRDLHNSDLQAILAAKAAAADAAAAALA
jgi:ribonuclease HI